MSKDPFVPEVHLRQQDEGDRPDALTPWAPAYENDALARKFDLPSSYGLLDALDDPSALIQQAAARGHTLSVAEVLLSEMLADMRKRTHHQGSSAIMAPIEQGAAGYTRVAQPPSGNQILRVRTIVLAPDTGTGTVQFLHGVNGSASDAALSGILPVTVGNPLFLNAANPRENPLMFTSPGAILGLNTVSNKFHGWIVYDISEGGEN